MAWSVDNTAQGSYNNSNPDTVNITIASTARLLVVTRWTNGTTAPTGGVPTANGTSLTDSGAGFVFFSGGECGTQVWYLINPPTGSVTVSIPNTNTTFGMVVCSSYIPSLGGAEFVNYGSANGDSADPSTTYSVGYDNCLLFGALASGYRTVPTAGTGYTIVATYDAGNQTWGTERNLDSGTSGTKTVDFVQPSDDWGLIGAAFREVVGAQALTPTAYTNTNSFGAPTVSPQPVTVTATQYTDTDSFGSHTVEHASVTQELTATHYVEAADSFGNHTVEPQPVTVTTTQYTDPDSFGAPSIAAIYNLTATAYTDPDSFGNHRIYNFDIDWLSDTFNDALVSVSSSDDFNDNSIDATKWYKGSFYVGYDPNVTVLEQNNRLEITTLNTTGSHYNGLLSQRTYDVYGSAVWVEIPQAGSGVPVDTSLVLFDPNNSIEAVLENGVIYFVRNIGGTPTYAADLTYNATNHRWWRIRHQQSDDTFYFDTSPDGSTWTNQRSHARSTLPLTEKRVALQAGSWGASAVETIHFDNYGDTFYDALWKQGTVRNWSEKVTLSRSNGKISITPASSQTGTLYNGLQSNRTFNFTDGITFVKLDQAPSGTAVAELSVFSDINNKLSIYVENGTIYFNQTITGTPSNTTLTYDPSAHRWWRIRHEYTDDTIKYDTSPDGIAWTNRRSVSRSTLVITSMRLSIGAGTYESVASPGVATFDNLNRHPLVPAKRDWSAEGVVLQNNPTPGEWDYILWGAQSPTSLIKFGSTYFLYYTGSENDTGEPDWNVMYRALGVATSTDLVNWTKYAGNPIVEYTTTARVDWEEGVGGCSVLVEGSTIHMWYAAIRSIGGGEVDIDVRYRSSTDGYTFTGDTLVYTSAGNEYMPIGATFDGTTYRLYMRGPLAGGKGPLSVISGTSPTSLGSKTDVDTNTNWQMGTDTRVANNLYLSVVDFALAGHEREHYRFHTNNNPNVFEEPIYWFNPHGAVFSPAIFRDEDTGKWILTYQNNERIWIVTHDQRDVWTVIDTSDTDSFGNHTVELGSSTQNLTATMYGDSDSFGAPTVTTSTVFYVSYAAVIIPEVSGLQILTPTHYTDGDSFGNHTVAPQPVTITATQYTDPDSFGNHTVAPQPVTITATHFSDSDSFGNHTVESQPVTLTATQYTDPDSFGAPVVAPQPVTVIATSFTDGDSFGAPVVQVGAKNLTATAYTDPDSFGNHTVAPQPVTVTTTAYTDPDSFGNHIVQVSAIELVTTAYTDPDSFGNHTVEPQPVTVTATAYTDPDSFGNHLVTAGELILVSTLFVDPDSFGNHTITPGPVTVTTTAFTDPDNFGNHTVEPQAITITATQYSDPDSFGNHLVTTGELVVVATLYNDPDNFGNHTVEPQPISVTHTSFTDPDSFGAPTAIAVYDLTVPSHTDPDSFGAPVVDATYDLTATAYTDPDSFGTPVVLSDTTLVATLIVDSDSFGNPTITVGPVTLVASHITDPDSFGSHGVSSNVFLDIAQVIHGHLVDNVALTQLHKLVISEVFHGHTIDNLYVTVPIIISDISHVVSSDAVVLTYVIGLVVEDLAHAVLSDQVIFSVTPVIAGINHTHGIDSVGITQLHKITIQDALHDHYIDEVVFGWFREAMANTVYISKELAESSLIAQQEEDDAYISKEKSDVTYV